MSAAFEWDKAMGIDPMNLRNCVKDQIDDVFNMLISVIVHTSHMFQLHLKHLLSCLTINASLVLNDKLNSGEHSGAALTALS